MQINVTEAKGQLLDLVRRAEAGEDVVLMRRGREVIRLVPIVGKPAANTKRALMTGIFEAAKASRSEGPAAARSQDFLYDDEGLPR
jgi:prevent-host-death family protein